jgi:hypothetical protein
MPRQPDANATKMGEILAAIHDITLTSKPESLYDTVER